jgi:hypothetical protein
VLARSVEGNAKQPHIWESEQKESIRCRVIETVMMVALSIQELRRLLAHLQKTRTPDMSGQSGDVTIKLKPSKRTIESEALKYKCCTSATAVPTREASHSPILYIGVPLPRPPLRTFTIANGPLGVA